MPISRAMINKELRNKGGAVKKKKKDKNWIQGAVKRPGALRKKLGVAKGKKISASQLNKAAKSKNPTTRRQANLAKTFKKMNRRRA
jgi:hypothetical protein|tara:strand:- start:927 stop:1184 length:258 start_codon:yes stop_codon:yes gene_type:complete